MKHNQCVNVSQSEVDEYSIIANKLFNLFNISEKFPDLLVQYLQTLDEALINETTRLLTMEDTKSRQENVKSWSSLLRKNQIPLQKLSTVYYSILCNLSLPWLKINDQLVIKQYQMQLFSKHLGSTIYGSEEEKRGFEKLTSFFCTQFLTIHNAFE